MVGLFEVVREEVLEVEIAHKENVYVYIHHQGQSMHRNTRNTKIQSIMGNRNQVSITKFNYCSSIVFSSPKIFPIFFTMLHYVYLS